MDWSRASANAGKGLGGIQPQPLLQRCADQSCPKGCAPPPSPPTTSQPFLPPTTHTTQARPNSIQFICDQRSSTEFNLLHSMCSEEYNCGACEGDIDVCTDCTFYWDVSCVDLGSTRNARKQHPHVHSS